jgi:hypothetical protein
MKDRRSLYHWISIACDTAFIFLLAIYPRLFEIQENSWQYIFAGASALSLIALGAHHMTSREPINRFLFALYCFSWVMTGAFSIQNKQLLMFANKYKAATYMLYALIVGIVTTLSSSSGFIGAQKGGKRAIESSSLMLYWEQQCLPYYGPLVHEDSA